MSQTIDLGLITAIGCGQWSNTVAYKKGQYVMYNASGASNGVDVYVCTANTTAGTLPTNTNYWHKETSIGELNNAAASSASSAATSASNAASSESNAAASAASAESAAGSAEADFKEEVEPWFESKQTEFEEAKEHCETVTSTAEGLMSSFSTAENARLVNEGSNVSSSEFYASGRCANERTRISNESTRQSNESTRQSNESTRQSAEEGRRNAEGSRVLAEQSRVSTSSSDHSRAESDHTASANATAASETQTERCRVMTATCSTKTSECITATATANTDHTTAVTDHSTATSDHSTAASDHTRAVSDHDRAEADHVNIVYTTADQGLTDTQKLNARNNIGAASSAELADLDRNIGDLRDLDTEAHGSLVEAINEVYGYAFEEDGHVYGVRHYYNQASPILTRFQTSQLHDLHQLLPVQSLMRRCILKDNGEVAYYLDHSDSTKKEDGTDAVLDGTDGMVMVEIPTHYRKHTLVENADDASLSYYESAISLLPFSGAFKVNKCYISAYEAAIDRTNNKLASVCNNTARYRGGNNNADWDGTNKTLLGRPASVQSLESFRNLARARGSMWNCQELDIYNTLYWLYTIEYANLNCQAAYNENRDGSGRHQGGLGDGVTNMPNWDQWSYYPIVPCGVTNTLGNATGVVTHNVMKADGETIHYAAKVPSYRGVENPFGHIWKWTDGFIAIGNGTKQEYYTCHDRSHYSSSKNDYYTSKGLSEGNNGYVKDFIRNADGDVLCSAVGGGSTTYGCDYHYEAWNNGTTYGLRLGGNAANGASAGFACACSDNAHSAASAGIGSRLCWSLHNTIVE